MPQIYGKTAMALPTRNADAVQVEAREGSYGDLVVLENMVAPDMQAYEGSRFVMRNAPGVTPAGTAMGIQTTFSDTANVALTISNGDANLSAIMDFIRLRCTAAGSTTTSSEVAIEVDNTNRYSSGGSTVTIQNANATAAAPASICTARIGAITAAAAGSRRRWLGQHALKFGTAPAWVASSATVQGDVVTMQFGAYSMFQPQTNAAYATTPVAVYQVLSFPPAVIPPGGSLVVHIANVANATTAPSFDWEASWIER